MPHDAQVIFKPELLVDVELPPGWRCGRHPEGTWWASGPCPKCEGDAYGPTLPPDTGGDGAVHAEREIVAAKPVAEVRADCRCNFVHGDGSTSCGRYWVVQCYEAKD